MTIPTRYQLWHGIDASPKPHLEVRAGEITALLDGIDIRYVRFGSIELVRRIYVAVRDEKWGTIPVHYTINKQKISADSFVIEFDAHHEEGTLQFSWHGTISGDEFGIIRYDMSGIAESDFLYNRIGICVLHPYQEFSGCTFNGRAGEKRMEGTLPVEIGPQQFKNGCLQGLIEPYDELVVDLKNGIQVKHAFQGELFEMEDQRNWTDASFKTYSTPLSLGFPHRTTKGQIFHQSVNVSVRNINNGKSKGDGKDKNIDKDYGYGNFQNHQPANVSHDKKVISIEKPLNLGMPKIGFQLSTGYHAPTDQELEYLRKLRPDHIRIDIKKLDPSCLEALEQAKDACGKVGCRLELALFVDSNDANGLKSIGPLLQQLQLARILVFHKRSSTPGPFEVTPLDLVKWVRNELFQYIADTPFVAGTNFNFCELNRSRPNVDEWDGVCYPINPQVHAEDTLSVVETLQAQVETVQSAMAIVPDKPLIISPVTLKPRSDSDIGGSTTVGLGQLPYSVDCRQMSLFGAGWTLGSLKYLAEANVHSITFYETTGFRGLMDVKGRYSKTPFPTVDRMVFPMYHVFANLAERKECKIVGCNSSHPLEVIGFAFHTDHNQVCMVANLTSHVQEIAIHGIRVNEVKICVLDEFSVDDALFHTESLNKMYQSIEIKNGMLPLTMHPFALIKVACQFDLK